MINLYECGKCGAVLKLGILDTPKKCSICQTKEFNLIGIEQTPEEEEYTKELIKKVSGEIMSLLDKYMDMTQDNKLIVTNWIIGTYLFKDFNTFPRLFINATKGSGKTRLLKILEALCWNGKIHASLTEAVLFRSASQHTLIFDEAESINSKEKGTLRELLNSGYKRGGKVSRMRKANTKEGERQVVEEFDLYSPVAIANINGLDDVLADRSIYINIDKSDNPFKVNLSEDFDKNMAFINIKRTLDLLVCRCVDVCILRGYMWNAFLMEKLRQHTPYTHIHTSTHYTQYTHTEAETMNKTLEIYCKLTGATTPEDREKVAEKLGMKPEIITEEEVRIFEKVFESKINGRFLELYMPLFFIADKYMPETIDDIIRIAKEKMHEKKNDDTIFSRDVSLLDFVATLEGGLNYYSVSELTQRFREFIGADLRDDAEINSQWVGHALKRLNLVLDKVRKRQGYSVVLDVGKAKEKMRMYK